MPICQFTTYTIVLRLLARALLRDAGVDVRVPVCLVEVGAEIGSQLLARASKASLSSQVFLGIKNLGGHPRALLRDQNMEQRVLHVFDVLQLSGEGRVDDRPRKHQCPYVHPRRKVRRSSRY